MFRCALLKSKKIIDLSFTSKFCTEQSTAQIRHVEQIQRARGKKNIMLKY